MAAGSWTSVLQRRSIGRNLPCSRRRHEVLVDGGIRSGVDIFKALALGADGVVIARPFVTAVYGGAEEGVKFILRNLPVNLKIP